MVCLIAQNVAMVMWMLATVYVLLAGIVGLLSTKLEPWRNRDENLVIWGKPGSSWSFLPTQSRGGVLFAVIAEPGNNFPSFLWPLALGITLGTQTLLTLGLYCADVITSLVRDEMIWRAATKKTGIPSSVTPYSPALYNLPSLALTIIKPVLRECHILHSIFWLTSFALRLDV